MQGFITLISPASQPKIYNSATIFYQRKFFVFLQYYFSSLMKSEEAKLQNISELHQNKTYNLPFISFLQQKVKDSAQSSKKKFLPYKSGKKKIKIRAINSGYQNMLTIESGLYIKPHLPKTLKTYEYQKAYFNRDKQICCLLKQKQDDFMEKHSKKTNRTYQQSFKLQAYSRYDVINAQKRYKSIKTNISDKILHPQLHSSFRTRLNAKQRVKKLLKTMSFENRDYANDKKSQEDLYNSCIQSPTNRRKVLQ